MIFLINTKKSFLLGMEDRDIDLQLSAMSELTKEIANIVEQTLEKGNSELTPYDIEHILKITADVATNLKIQKKIVTV